MARIATIVVLFTVVLIGVGCTGGTGIYAPTTVPGGTPGNAVGSSGEIDLVERVSLHRQQYREALEQLVNYYQRTGNNRYLRLAQSELASLRQMAQYNYTADVVPGPQLKATISMPEADALFAEAQKIQQESGLIESVNVVLPYAKNEPKLRMALDRYATLIRRFPASDKIDDAAFQAAFILELLKDYPSALTYYQRAYQWDQGTPYPARFKAAYLFDQNLHRKAEALELYQDAMMTEGARFPAWKEYTDRRLKELTKTPDDAPK